MPECRFVCVQCMDFRIQGTVTRLLQSLGAEGDCDIISVPGGAANNEYIKALKLSQKLHNSSMAILTVHEDCGAGARPEDLHTAAASATKEGFSTTLYVIKLDGTWEPA